MSRVFILTMALSLLILLVSAEPPMSESEVVALVGSARSAEEIIEKVVGHGAFHGYYTYKSFWEIKAQLQRRYPQFVGEDLEFGNTLQKNPLKAFFIGKKPNDSEAQKTKSATLIDSSHHAREAVSFEMILVVMLIEVNALVKNRPEASVYEFTSLLVYPVVNVDGVIAINEDFDKQKDRRKNLRDVGCGMGPDNGVDINRNYDIKFDIMPEATLVKCGDEFRGEKPFSEPETDAIRKIIETYPSVSSAINLHCWGNLWIHPYNFLKTGESFDMNVIQPKLARLYIDFKQTVTFPQGATVGDARTCVGYSATGEASDWMALKKNIFAWSPELGSNDHATDDFYIQPEPQRSVIRAQYPMVRQFLEKHRSKVTISVPLQSIKSSVSSTVVFQLNNICYNRLYKLQAKVTLTERGKNRLGTTELLSTKITYDGSDDFIDRLESAFLVMTFSSGASWLTLNDLNVNIYSNGVDILQQPEEDDLLESEHQVTLKFSRENRGVEGVVYIVAAIGICLFIICLQGPKIIRQRCKSRQRRPSKSHPREIDLATRIDEASPTNS